MSSDTEASEFRVGDLYIADHLWPFFVCVIIGPERCARDVSAFRTYTSGYVDVMPSIKLCIRHCSRVIR